MLNQVELVVLSILLERLKCFVEIQQIAETSPKNIAAQKIEERIAIIAFLAKQGTSSARNIKRFLGHLGKVFQNFHEKYKAYLEYKNRNGNKLDLSFSLQEFNMKWNSLSVPLQTKKDDYLIDFNYEVDNILQNSNLSQQISLNDQSGSFKQQEEQQREEQPPIPKRKGRPPKVNRKKNLGIRRKKEIDTVLEGQIKEEQRQEQERKPQFEKQCEEEKDGIIFLKEEVKSTKPGQRKSLMGEDFSYFNEENLSSIYQQYDPVMNEILPLDQFYEKESGEEAQKNQESESQQLILSSKSSKCRRLVRKEENHIEESVRRIKRHYSSIDQNTNS